MLLVRGKRKSTTSVVLIFNELSVNKDNEVRVGRPLKEPIVLAISSFTFAVHSLAPVVADVGRAAHDAGAVDPNYSDNEILRPLASSQC